MSEYNNFILENHKNISNQFDNLDISLKEFTERIEKIILPKISTEEKLPYLKKLHLTDLYLAMSCQKGNENGWKIFNFQYKNHEKNDFKSAIFKNSCCHEHAQEIWQSNEIDSLLYTKNVFINYEGRCSLRTFLFCIIRNHILSMPEIRCCRRKNIIEIDENKIFIENNPIHQHHLSNLLKNEWVSIVQKTVYEIISNLSSDDQDLIRQHFYFKKTKRELAQIKNIGHASTLGRKMEKLLKNIKEKIIKIMNDYGYNEKDIIENLPLLGKEIYLWS